MFVYRTELLLTARLACVGIKSLRGPWLPLAALRVGSVLIPRSTRPELRLKFAMKPYECSPIVGNRFYFLKFNFVFFAIPFWITTCYNATTKS
jgi:hypothetical protein